MAVPGTVRIRNVNDDTGFVSNTSVSPVEADRTPASTSGDALSTSTEDSPVANIHKLSNASPQEMLMSNTSVNGSTAL